MGEAGRRVGFAIGCVLLVSGLAACSGDGDTLSEETFIEQGNAICAEGSAELEAASEDLFGAEEPTAEQLSDFADFFEENIRDQIDAVDELDGPSDLEDELDPLLDDSRAALEEFVTGLREDPESVFSGNDPFTEVNSQLVALGLTACGEDE